MEKRYQELRPFLFVALPYFVTLVFVVAYAMWLNNLKDCHAISANEFTSNLTSVVGWVVVLLIGFIHLQKTRRDNRLAKKEELRKSIERQAFREINQAITGLSETLIALSVGYQFFRQTLSKPTTIQNPVLFDKERTQHRFSQTNIDLTRALAEFLLAIEANEIAVLRFDHLRKYIQFRADDLGKLTTNFYSSLMSTTLNELATDEKLSEFNRKCKEIDEESLNVNSYLFDYRIELMNSLFGSVFDCEVPARKSMDIKSKTLREVAIKEEVQREEEERYRRAMAGH